MKRLLTIVIIIGIIAYIVVQFLNDRRFNPPSSYDYVISQNIDKDFYDPLVLKEYYKTALEVGSYARALWRNEHIDVRFIDNENFESSEATEYYNQLIVAAKMLEAKLEKSTELKGKGYTSTQVKVLFEENLTPQDLKLRENSRMLGLSKGSTGATVWELQKRLNAQGDSIPQDGIFNLITTNRLKTFQQKHDLFPSGEVDLQTLKALIQ